MRMSTFACFCTFSDAYTTRLSQPLPPTRCPTLRDDVLLAFRDVCQKTYGLDPCHYYTAAELTRDAGLKYTRVTLDYP